MTRFEQEYQHLNTAQKQAVDIIDGPVLVIAGPGTGKTQLLSLRVANILRKTDVQPYNILCLTYTESGKKAMIERLTDFLGNTSKQVEVNTFHGFGSRLITRFPDYFPELAQFRPAEDLTLYETLLACMLRLPRSNPLSKHAYGQFTYQTDARDRISQLKRAGIPPEAAKANAEVDLDWCRAEGRKVAAAFQSAGRLSAETASGLTANLAKVLTSSSESELGRSCLDELREAMSIFENENKTTGLSAFKKKWLVTDENKLYFKPTDQMKKLAALAELYDAYESELKQRQLYDYDDMILYALEKLKNNSEFRAQVQETFQYILADEYQDTNAAQASIINLIAASPVNEGRPNVMVVGDDDQAIYGFQGALGDVLMDFRERWRDVRVVTLKDNYRSTSSILDTARAVISQGQNRLENYYEDIDKTLTPQTKYRDVAPTIFETSSAETVIDKAVRVAKDSSADNQLAIIATKHKYLQELADKLDGAKVSYYYEGREDLLQDDSIVTLMLLADAIQAIKQKDFIRTNYVLPEIFALGIIRLPRTLAWKTALDAKSQKKSWWEIMSKLNAPDAQNASRVLSDLSKTVKVDDAETSLKTIAKNYQLRVVQKIKRLYAHALSYYGREEVSLYDLLRYCELCKQAGVSLEHTIVKGNKHAPVVLLSAHRSKGLEFDRVYILHADYQTWFIEKGRRNNIVFPPNWQAIEPLATNTDDRLRLLYVVMTRARQELALIKTEQGEIFPGLEDLKTNQYVTEQIEAFNVPEALAWRSWYMPKTDKEKAILQKLLKTTFESYRLSPTHLTIFLDVAHGGPVTFLTNILLGIPEPLHPEAIFGSFVHKTLRFAQDQLNKTGKLPSKQNLENFVFNETAVRDEIRGADIIQVVYDFLEHSDILRPGGVGEYSFSAQNLSLNEACLTGNVDHFVLNNGLLTITDYKTGRALNSWRVTEDYYKQKLHRFRQQLLFYELLFKLSPDFEVENMTSKIAFVEPSRRDVYYELILDADQTERQRLEQLINVVWLSVINLSLPDTQVYGTDMNGMIAFEDDLLAFTNKKTPQ